MDKRIFTILVASVLSAALSGCSALGSPPGVNGKVASAETTHEYPSARPRAQRTADPSASALAAIRAFASTYINWTADTVSGQMRWLAAHSVGQARSAMELAAAQTAHDYELQRSGIANSGTVEAITVLLGHREEFVVVTRELTSATNASAYQGLRPAWHLALADVLQPAPGRWVVSRWQPES